jgi:hypothetical protein
MLLFSSKGNKVKVQVFIVAAFLSVSFSFPINQQKRLAASSIIRSSSPLEAQLSLQTVAIARQINPAEYERLLRSTIPPSDTIIRWYIASFSNDSAIIEVVVEKES